MDIEEQPYDDRHGPREERFNPFDTPSKAVGREVGGDDLQSAIDLLADAIDQGAGPVAMRDAASVVLFALRQRMDAEEAPVPMPKRDANYTLDKAIVDTERAVRLNHLGHYTGMVSMVLGALQDRMLSDIEQNEPVNQTAEDPWALGPTEDVDPPVPGTPLDTQSGLRYIAPGGTFAAYWTGEGNGPQLAQTSLLALRVLSAHLTTALDHVTGELELRRH